MLEDYGASRGYTHFVHQYNGASMLYHCLHALTMYHGSLLANNKPMCMDYERDRNRFSEGGYGPRDFDLEPLISLKSIFPEVLRLRLRGHVRCLFITAILLMKYYRYFILFLFTLLRYGVSLVVKGCFESGQSSNDLAHVCGTCENRKSGSAF